MIEKVALEAMLDQDQLVGCSKRAERHKMKNLNSIALIAVLATSMTTAVGVAEAKSKTKRAAETAVKVLPMSKPAKTLMKANIRIYDRLGWEAGRLMSTMEHGPAGDPGKYRGYSN